MITVVYPYRFTQSDELDWSLRSLRNVGHDNVLIVGDTPPFPVSANMVMPDRERKWSRLSPYQNQISKYLTACEQDIGEDLILMNDDFFILKPVDHTNFHRGTLHDHIASRRRDSYVIALKNTQDILQRHGYAIKSFELHVPMFVKKSLLKQAIEEIIPVISRKTIMIRSYYGNRFGIESVRMDDVKNTDEINGFISSDDKTFTGQHGEMIRAALT